MKTFISPQSWFMFEYPDNWFEFEEEADVFLFYDPDRWDGNFRISATRDVSRSYASRCLQDALGQTGAKAVTVGRYDAVLSVERFREGGAGYVDRCWLVGCGQTCVEVSFTSADDGSTEVPTVCAEVLNSLRVNVPGAFFPSTLITPRLMELYEVDEAYNTMERLAKKVLKAKFTDPESTLKVLQRLADSGALATTEDWQMLGLAFCAVMVDGCDGYEWRTLVDGMREQPMLLRADGVRLDPYTLFRPGKGTEQFQNI